MSNPNQVVQTGECANATVTTSTGKVYNLGKPGTRRFRFRRWLYIRREGIKFYEDGTPYSKKRGK